MRGAMYGTSYFQSVLEKSDICLLTEHWLNKSNISFFENFDSRFDTVYSIGMNCSSYTKGSGGTAILVRKSPGYKIYNLNLKNDRICGIKLCSNEYQDICVLCVLLPSTNYTQEVYLKYLDDLCKYYDMYCEDNVTLIGGDFNIDITNQNISGKAVNYIEFLKDRNLRPTPLKQGCLGPMYTFRSKDDNIRTLLDYVCIPEFISNDIPFSKLIESKSGLIIEHLHIPCVLLADDTTLLSSSKNGLQILLNIVHEYAQRWRLKYNALKSKFLLFSPKKYMQKPDYVFSFGDATVTYAGTLLDCSRRTFGRTDMAYHRLVRLSATDPFFTRGLLLLTRLGSVAIKRGQCTLCNHYTDDIVKHLNCEHVVDIRNEMFYAIVNLISVQDSVKLFQQDEDDMRVTLLGGVNDYVKQLNSDVWKQLMLCLTGHMLKLYNHSKSVLFYHNFNFGH
ncbi:unnamed protein product [Mytilus coruscus]|uniref:Endonuclease/exonuclease/phosphatase domain-containing protein n=1 Tax=Mytilus coruscus TaxID=42192 RepID=A0A6J8ATA9_MYTCO|nr:unnamed protein product [Mytilus coruscus]